MKKVVTKPKICGIDTPIGWTILNPNWPSGKDPHLIKCVGCINCETL